MYRTEKWWNRVFATLWGNKMASHQDVSIKIDFKKWFKGIRWPRLSHQASGCWLKSSLVFSLGRPRKAPPEGPRQGGSYRANNNWGPERPSDGGSESNLEKMKIWRTFSRLDRDRDDFRVDTVLKGAKGDWVWFFCDFGFYIVGQMIRLSQKIKSRFLEDSIRLVDRR